jgi:Na+-translocating ferredoxin:NAD+ oxidoreductase RNF subunit RnfB
MIVTDILLALAVVGSVGFIAAILLALVSHFFSVPENETKKNIRAELPGANCGACGFSGCDAYAKALAENPETPANLCRPGGEATVNASNQGGLSDTTAGGDLAQDTNVPANHLLIVPRDDGRGFEATTDVIIMVKGAYEIK